MDLWVYMGVRLSTNGWVQVQGSERPLNRTEVYTLIEVTSSGKIRVLRSEVR